MSIAFGARQPCDERRPGRLVTPCARRTQRWVLAVSVIGSSLAFIESSIVNLALPSLQTSLGLDAVRLQWVVNAYLLTLSSLILVGGAAGDRFGLRRVYVAGLLVFGTASGICGLVNDATSLIGFRAIQGVGAAFLVPTSLALLNVYFAPEDRPRAIGIWAGASALTTAAGPVLGGGLVDVFGWRAVFLLIAPFAFIALLLALWKVPGERPNDDESLDLVGAAWFMPSLALLTYALAESTDARANLALFLVGTLSLVGFLIYERRAANPMLPLSLFSSQAFSGANAMTVLLYFALGGALYFVPFNLMQIQGYSALQAGAAFLPMTLMLGFGSVVAGDLLKQYPPRAMLTLGATLTAAGLALLMMPSTSTSYVASWLPGIALVGFGMTLCVSPLTTVVMASVNEAQSGTASGINNTAARLAGMLAIALLTTFAISVFSASLDGNLTALDIPVAVRAEILDDSHRLAELVLPPGAADDEQVVDAVRSSYVTAFRTIIGVCAVCAALAAVLAWFTLGRVEIGTTGNAHSET